MGISSTLKSPVFKGLFVLIGVVVAVAGLTPPVQAATITYYFSGTVDAVGTSLGSTIFVGEALTGSYTFDPSIAGTGTNESAVYDALTSFSLSIGSYSGSSAASEEIQVDSGSFGASDDRYAVVSRVSQGLSPLIVNGSQLGFFTFRLDDTTDSQFTAGALTLPTSLSLPSFNSNGFFLDFGDFSTPFVVSGTLNYLSETAPSAVPEPTSLLLLGTGVFGIGLAAWRRRKA